jgi:hypothetical protein
MAELRILVVAVLAVPVLDLDSLRISTRGFYIEHEPEFLREDRVLEEIRGLARPVLFRQTEMEVGYDRRSEGETDLQGRAVRALEGDILDLLHGRFDESKAISLCLRRALGAELVEQRRSDSQPVELKVEAAEDDQHGAGATEKRTSLVLDRRQGLTHCRSCG